MRSSINKIILDEISRFVKDVITEDKESKNMAKARRYIRSVNPNADANEIVHAVRNDIPNVRVLDCKYLLGTVRLYLKGELQNARNILDLNRYLHVLGSMEEYSNAFDNDFNGLSYHDISEKLEPIVQQVFTKDKELLSKKEYKANTLYDIVNIESFEDAEKYGRYTNWCVTYSENAYDKYTKDGLGRFYFCLKKGFENTPKEIGENCPLDEYGLSMIATSVNEDGSCNTITPRWNHDNGSNDHIMTPEELSDIIGMNYYEVFKPYTKEELHARGIITFQEAQEMLERGVDPNNIFKRIYNISDGFSRVKLNGKYNFLTEDNKLLSPNQWFDEVYDFEDGFARVKLNGKFNLLTKKGNILSPNQWFDRAYNFEDGLALVSLDRKYNLLTTDGELLSPNQWFDNASEFKDGLALVSLDGKCNFLTTDGELLSPNQWFDYAYDFKGGFAAFMLDNRWNFLTTDGELLSPNQWFDLVNEFKGSFALVSLDRKYNLLTTDGNILSPNQWFDKASDFKGGFARIKLNNRWNFLTTDCELLSPNQWFDEVYDFEDGFAEIVLNKRCNFLTTDGELLSPNQWFDYASSFKDGFAVIVLDRKYNFLTTDGDILSPNQWFDKAYDFKGGFADIILDGEYRKITTKGELL